MILTSTTQDVIPGSNLDDTILGVRHPQSVLRVENEPPYASSDDFFRGENRARVAGPRSNVKFAASGLTHLGPIRDAFKHTGVSISGSSLGRDQSQRSSKYDGSLRSQSSRGQAKILSSENSHREVSLTMSTASEESGNPIVTMRFEHREDENGHHFLVGCEGKLTRCEDEPIRVPGAVQCFGVLMVLHDDRTTGKLPVRQVSEASSSLNE